MKNQSRLSSHPLLRGLPDIQGAAGLSWSCVAVYTVCLGLPVHPAITQVVLAVATVSAFSAVNGQQKSVPAALWLALGAFLILTGLSISTSTDPRHAIDVSISLVSGTFLLFTCSRLESVRAVHALLMGFCLAGLIIASVYILVAALNWNASVESWMSTAPYPQFGVPNDLGILAITGIVALTFFRENQAGLQRGFLVAVVAAVISCLLIYRSRGGILVLTALAVYLICRRRQLRWVYILPGIALLGVVIDALSGFAFLLKVAQVQTVSTRIPLWIAAVNMFVEAPLLGHGPGSFALMYRDFVDQAMLPDWILIDERDMPWPHNLYLELLAERGIMGLLAFGAIVTITLRLIALSCYRTGPTFPGRVSAALGYALAGLLILGLFESSLLRHWVVVAYAFIIGLVCVMWRLSNYREQQ